MILEYYYGHGWFSIKNSSTQAACYSLYLIPVPRNRFTVLSREPSTALKVTCAIIKTKAVAFLQQLFYKLMSSSFMFVTTGVRENSGLRFVGSYLKDVHFPSSDIIPRLLQATSPKPKGAPCLQYAQLGSIFRLKSTLPLPLPYNYFSHFNITIIKIQIIR